MMSPAALPRAGSTPKCFTCRAPAGTAATGQWSFWSGVSASPPLISRLRQAHGAAGGSFGVARRVRQLLPGLAYTLPPKPARPDFLETSAASIVAAACEKDLPVAQALGKTVAGVGPVVVREAVCRALGETPALACDLTADEKAHLAAAIDALKDEHAHGGTPTAVRLPQADGAPKPVEFSFFVPQQYGSEAILTL